MKITKTRLGSFFVLVLAVILVWWLIGGCAQNTEPIQGMDQNQAQRAGTVFLYFGDNRGGDRGGGASIVPAFLNSNGFASIGSGSSGETLVDRGRAANLTVAHVTINNGGTDARGDQAGTQTTSARQDPESGVTASIPIAAAPGSSAQGGAPSTATGGSTASSASSDTATTSATVYRLQGEVDRLTSLVELLQAIVVDEVEIISPIPEPK